ncbi:hypothetical protein MLD38_005959 [Melastoma candidum]|uniref:Uncharacterized protein n=1 Tax=Melastoma candidum TaxID=119954 RepID=A0ACB9RKS6_9MYRT|nr:hypothetical protein MLD38_005959 [Melastoma candidum]
MAGKTGMFFLVAFLSAAISVQAFSLRPIVQRKTHVVVFNDLPRGESLSFKCSSWEGDLGHYTLHKGGSQDISFYISLWGEDTIVACDFYWGENQRRSFDIYNQDKDTFRCSETCRLHIEPRGPFYYTEVVVEKRMHSYKSIWVKVPQPWK